MQLFKFLVVIGLVTLSACVKPGDPDSRDVVDTEKQALRSPDVLKAAGLGAVSLGAKAKVDELFVSEVNADVFFRRVDSPNAKLEWLGTGSKGLGKFGFGPYVRALEPGAYALFSFKYLAGRGENSGTPGAAFQRRGEPQPADFVLRAGEVLNLGEVVIGTYLTETERQKRRRDRRRGFYIVSRASSQAVAERFKNDYPTLAPVLESRPITCPACPPRPPEN